MSCQSLNEIPGAHRKSDDNEATLSLCAYCPPGIRCIHDVFYVQMNECYIYITVISN